MKRVLFAVSITTFLMLLAGCGERPIKTERVCGIVVSMNGNYYGNTKKPLACRVVTEVEGVKLITTYRVEYYQGAFYSGPYEECWKALLLKEGDPVNVMKLEWADSSVTYSLDP